jgi:hypothetical protein
MQQSVFELIDSFNHDALKSTPKAALVQSIEFISMLLSTVLPEEDAGKVVETFQLSLSIKCLNSPSFQKRYQGLTTITRLISMAQRREFLLTSPISPVTAPNTPLPKCAKWLTCEYVCHCLQPISKCLTCICWALLGI